MERETLGPPGASTTALSDAVDHVLAFERQLRAGAGQQRRQIIGLGEGAAGAGRARGDDIARRQTQGGHPPVDLGGKLAGGVQTLQFGKILGELAQRQLADQTRGEHDRHSPGRSQDANPLSCRRVPESVWRWSTWRLRGLREYRPPQNHPPVWDHCRTNAC